MKLGEVLSVWVVFLITNMLLGAWSLNYVLMIFIGKHIPIFATILGGLVLGQFTVPLAILCWIIKLC
ncbi:MAG TPA: hypothetical protein VEP90_09610, partial [Methylomirabilota bacterium]|nr:hypothetical protein [Methylomirabilota bacterium]